MTRPGSVPELTEALRDVGYLADRGLATTVHVALTLGRPVLLEGEVGVVLPARMPDREGNAHGALGVAPQPRQPPCPPAVA